MAKEKIAVALSNELETLAAQFADAMAEGAALQTQLGDMAREVARVLQDQQDNLAAFIDAARQLCIAHGLTEGSVDKTLSHLRGVVRAIWGGYAPAEDLSLRAMYEAIPKDPNKGGPKPRKPRQSAKGAQDATAKGSGGEAANEPAPTRPATKEDLIRALFGHFDPDLQAAVEYAVKHEAMFTAWASASAKAAQAADLPAVKPLPLAQGAKNPRIRRAA